MDIQDMAGHVLRRLHQNAAQVFQTGVRAAGYDLTPVQYAALETIRAWPGLDQASLSDLIACDRATLSGVVDRLCSKGYVKRTVSPRDRRARVLTLTDEGTRLVVQLTPVVAALQQRILPGLTQQERAAFMDLARKAARETGKVG